MSIAHSHHSIPFHRWLESQSPLLAIIIIFRFRQTFFQRTPWVISKDPSLPLSSILFGDSKFFMNDIKKSVLQTHFNRSISTTVKTHSGGGIHQNNLDCNSHHWIWRYWCRINCFKKNYVYMIHIFCDCCTAINTKYGGTSCLRLLILLTSNFSK